MTEDQIRAAVRAEIAPFRQEVNGRFDSIEKRLDLMNQRLDVATNDRKEMLRILQAMNPRKPAGGRVAEPREIAAKDSN